MAEKHGGERSRFAHLVSNGVRLLTEVLVGSLTLVGIVAIEAPAAYGLHWLVIASGSEILGYFVSILEGVVLCVDGLCFLAMLFVSLRTYMKEVR